uniref:SURP motif domain-containing protein n=1 Tax=Davidia involucrata TaxID=16924 RepID=A0A5B6ZBX9_DAVIN
MHQIIARTAMFVSKHGGQSEIVLRVKQGDNPTFGFLIPGHHLHAYFRFLVDHQELMQYDIDGKPQNDNKTNTEHNQTDDVGGGALSLLGSVYGYGEDEDGAGEDASESKENVSWEKFDAVSAAVSHGSEKTDFPVIEAGKEGAASKHPRTSSKEKAPALKRNSFISASKAGTTTSTKKGDTLSSIFAVDKSQVSAMPTMSKIEPLVLEPPFDLKRLVDRIVEFILKNGKQFEAVLIEQDSKHGRFPFLLPSNQYHPYYQKVLQKAQESKLAGKSFLSEKDDSVGHGPDKKTSRSKEESDSLSLGSGCDMPYDSDRKEKFKMVIGKSKKDGQDPPSKATQQQFGVSVDAAAAAAILQAATRGIKNPNLGILSSTSLNGNSHMHSSEGGQASSLGSHLSSQPESVIQKSDQNGKQCVSVPVAKAIAKTAALEVASEADSSEARLTREQKLKAERLKRAKMFVSMLKSGDVPLKTEPSRGISVERQESGFSGSGAEIVNLAGKEREGSSVPLDVDTSDKNEKSEKKYSDDEYNERRLRRKYRSRSMRDEDDDDDDKEEKDHKHSMKKQLSPCSSHDDGKEGEERDRKHSRKKHRSYRSSREDEEERDHKHSRKKHRSHHSSREDEEDGEERDLKHSRKKHRSRHSSRENEEDEEENDHKHSRKKHRSHRSSHHSRDTHKHRKRHSSSKEMGSRQWHKHDSTSDDEHQHDKESDKRRKKSHSEREELEEGEISSRISDQSRGSVGDVACREVSPDLLNSYQDGRAPSRPSETTEVSDDLRAKIRAMLMATL